MQDQATRFNDHNRLLERAIVSQTLREDRNAGWQRIELAAELVDADPIALRDALSHLKDDGIVECAGELVKASRPTLRLNDLDMIAV